SREGFIPLRIAVDEREGLALARGVGVVSIPTVVFFDGSGKVVGTYVGYQSPREMAKILERHMPEGTS
ncbi:MAG: thioredoxin fold domain-containing protein, partial [Fidelibacterota bacterium]